MQNAIHFGVYMICCVQVGAIEAKVVAAKRFPPVLCSVCVFVNVLEVVLCCAKRTNGP